jgi:hypothetical protein
MHKEKPSYWSILPADVRYCKKITANAKILYTEITALSSKEGYCWATNKYFADLYKVSEVSISTWVSSLVDQNYITSEMSKSPTGSRRKLRTNTAQGGHKENFKGGHKENFNRSNTSSSILTKVSNSDSEESLKKLFGYRCVREWNKFDYTRSHKSETIIKRVDKYMKQLLKGTFFNDKEVNKDFMKYHYISTNGRKYTKEELLKGIQNTSLLFKGGYSNLKNLPKGLDTLIYNESSGTSMFLSALFNPPKLLSKKFVKDSYPKITELFMNNGIEESSRFKIVKGIASLVEYQGRINCRIPKMKRLFGTPYLLCKTYLEWLNAQGWVNKVELGYIKADGKMFKKFIVDMEEECFGYSLIK